MEITTDYISRIIVDFFRRCETARALGGIREKDVVDGTAHVPKGWIFDPVTQYYLPPNVFLDEGSSKCH